MNDHPNQNLPSQPLYTSDIDLLAATRAAFFLVQSYQKRGFDAERTHRRIQWLMHRSRIAGLWTAAQYTFAARLYVDAFLRVYGERVTFDPAYD